MALGALDPGYQTPTEESHPPFIRTEPPTPTPSPPPVSLTQAATTPPAPVPSTQVSSPPSAQPPRRPPLLQLSSYYLQRRNERSRDVNPSLDDMLHKGVRRPKGGHVRFRERVACYQWTFFTMVCSPFTGSAGHSAGTNMFRPWYARLPSRFLLACTKTSRQPVVSRTSSKPVSPPVRALLFTGRS